MADPVWWFYILAAQILRREVWGEARNRSQRQSRRVPHCGRRLRRGWWTSSALIKRAWSVNAHAKPQCWRWRCSSWPRRSCRGRRACGPPCSCRCGCAAHQAWSANVYTLASDMFPNLRSARWRIGAFAGGDGRRPLSTNHRASSAAANGSDYGRSSSCAALLRDRLGDIHLRSPRLETGAFGIQET